MQSHVPNKPLRCVYCNAKATFEVVNHSALPFDTNPRYRVELHGKRQDFMVPGSEMLTKSMLGIAVEQQVKEAIQSLSYQCPHVGHPSSEQAIAAAAWSYATSPVNAFGSGTTSVDNSRVEKLEAKVRDLEAALTEIRAQLAKRPGPLRPFGKPVARRILP
jgi:hypothetical protein